MKTLHILISIILLSLLVTPVVSAESRKDKQARLDHSCESERQKKLIPIRKEIVDQCVANKERSSRKECERFYADYGERMGGRAPLFFDLPECVTAFEFQQGVRQRNS